jgi:quercetin dioxygenase-like cupin family protein
MSTAAAEIPGDRDKPFRFDASTVEWGDFFTAGTFYRILNVDLAARTADMIVKFEPNSQCMYHRHAATTQTLVLQGELRVREQVDGQEVIKVKPAGSFSYGGEGEIHIEGSGDEEAIIFFGMRTDTDVIYELLNDDLSLRRAVTVADFDRDWRERWPGDTQER